MPIEFFVSTDEEVKITNDFERFVELTCQYNIIAMGANDLKTVRDISNFFLQNEDFVPNQIIQSVCCFYSGKTFQINVYKFDKEFTKAIARIEHSKLDTPESIEYWHSKGYFSQAIWNAVYGLHNLCIFAVRDNKDVYMFQDIDD